MRVRTAEDGLTTPAGALALGAGPALPGPGAGRAPEGRRLEDGAALARALGLGVEGPRVRPWLRPRRPTDPWALSIGAPLLVLLLTALLLTSLL